MIRLCRLSTTLVWLFILTIACGTVRAELFEVETREDVMVPCAMVFVWRPTSISPAETDSRCRQMADHPDAHAVRQAE